MNDEQNGDNDEKCECVAAAENFPSYFFSCVCVVSFIENFKWNNWNAYDKIIDSVKNTLRYLANIHILVEHGKGYGMVAHYPSTSGVYFKLVKR